MLYGITFNMICGNHPRSPLSTETGYYPRMQKVVEAMTIAPEEDAFLFIISPTQGGAFVQFIEEFKLKDLIQYKSDPFTNPNYGWRPGIVMYILSKTPIERSEYVAKANIAGVA